MPPAQALVTSRPFSDVRQPALNLIYVVLSLSIVFICGTLLAYQSIVRRRRPINDSAPHRLTNFDSPVLLSNGDKERASFSPTVSALVTQSTLVASSPLRLKIILNLATPRQPISLLYHGFKRFLSWRRTTIGPVGVIASASSASIQHSLASTVSLSASSSVTSSNRDGSHDMDTTPLSPTLHQLGATRILKLFPGLRRQPISSDAGEHAEPHQYLPDQTDPVEDKDVSEPDLRTPDTINIPQILRSTDEAECKPEIPVIPFIILSIPSNEHLAEDSPQPCSLDEDLLSPERIFRSAGPLARGPVGTHDISDATRLALASRLGERRERPTPLPPPNVLGVPSVMHWPRWF